MNVIDIQRMMKGTFHYEECHYTPVISSKDKKIIKILLEKCVRRWRYFQ